MSDVNYPIEIAGNPIVGIPHIKASFGRITVLIGANGSGKSRVLNSFRSMVNSFGRFRPFVFIEGGRVIRPPANLRANTMMVDQFSSLTAAQASVRQAQMLSAADRIMQVLLLLDRRAAELKAKHSDEVTDWQRGGFVGPCPIAEEDSLHLLFRMFSDIFPEIKLTFNRESRDIRCEKNGSTYQPDELSDGERQVFFILADLALAAERNSLIVVDEPELNLNALLADRLWNMIEAQLPEAVFIYGTHSIGFAMRENVDRIIALGTGGKPTIEISDVSELPPHDAREFLGAIPAILSSPGAIAVEGEETSFDGGFYRWLVDIPGIAIVSLGGSSDVTAAVTRLGIWGKLAPSVKLLGIIDRDFKSDASLSLISQCLVLDYHEAESYFCHPEIFCSIASALGTAPHIPTVAETSDFIVTEFSNNILRVAATRMAYRAQIRLNVSLQGAAFKTALDEASLRKLIEDESNKEASKASSFIGAIATMKIFDEELERCRKALSDRDIDEILKLSPGKELAARLAPRAGCRDTAALARAAYKHLTIDTFPALKTLREKIRSALSV